MKNHQTTRQQCLMVFLHKKSLRYKNISAPFKNGCIFLTVGERFTDRYFNY